VSVVLPTYNRADTLPKAVESVLTQTYGDLELIVVDDGSSDGTQAMLDAVSDGRVRVVRNPVNHGVSAARNRGIAEARGRYIAFQDSDDSWRPRKLERQVALLEADDEVGVIGCGWQLQGTSPAEPVLPTVRGDIYREILADQATCLGTPMLLVRRLAAGQPMFDESLPALEERDFKLQYARRFRFEFADDVLVDVRRGRTDHVANPRNALASYERYLEKYAADLDRWPDIRSYYHWQAGRQAVMCQNRGAARRYFRLALKGGTKPGIWADAALGLAFGENGLRISSRLRAIAGRLP